MRKADYRPWFGPDKSGQRAARAAVVALARAPRNLSDGELKAVDVSIAASPCDTTGGVTLLNGLARGDDINQRNGREVLLKSIEIRLRNLVTAGTGTEQTHRVCIVYDRQSNGAAPTIADILSAPNVLYPRNLENRRRFKILYDRAFTLNATGEPGGERFHKFYRRLAHPVTFNTGNAGTIADITMGSLYLITMGTNAPGATAGICTGRCRVRYEDK